MLVVSTETVRKLPVTLRIGTGRVFAIALNGVLVLVFKRDITERRFFLFREKRLSLKRKRQLDYLLSPAVSTVLRPSLEAIVQCMT